MAQVIITINSREYALGAEDGQESNLIKLAQILDEKAKSITTSAGQINESLLLAMSGLLVADELFQLKKAQNIPSTSVDFEALEKQDLEIADKINKITDKIKSIVNSL